MTQPPGPNAIPPAPFPAVPPNHSSQVPIPPNPVWIQPKEPRATTAMVLGIIAVAGGMLCYLPALCGPVALYRVNSISGVIAASLSLAMLRKASTSCTA
jgi:hypothetical protein